MAEKTLIASYDRALQKWHHFSPSTLQAFADCERIPYYDKILRLPKERFKAQELGDKMHAQLEHLALEGQDLLAPRLRSLRQYLPEKLPDPHVYPELGLDGRTKSTRASGMYDYAHSVLKIHGVPLEGYIDLAYLDPIFPQVDDYKTTSSIEKWSMTEEQVKKSLPMLLYAKALLAWLPPNTPGVYVRHLYAQTKGAILCEPRGAALTRPEIDLRWDRAQRLGEGLLKLEGATSDEGIPQTGIAKGMCTKYHGCPYAAICLKSPAAMLKQRLTLAAQRNENQPQASIPTKEDQTMSLLARIKQAQTPVGTSNPTNGAHPTDGAGWVETKCTTCGESIGKRPPGHSVSAHEGCKGAPAKTSIIVDESTVPDEVLKAQRAQGVVPPDAPPNDKNAIPEEKGRKRKAKLVETKPSEDDSIEALEAKLAAAVAAKAEKQRLAALKALADKETLEKAEVARKTKEAFKADEARALEVQKVAEALEAGKKITITQPGSVTEISIDTAQYTIAGKLPIKLFVNCIPPEPFTMLDEYAAHVASEIATSLQTADFRLADRGAVQGTGAIAALVREEPPKPGTYVAFTSGFGTPLQVVVDALLPIVAYPVRGVR